VLHDTARGIITKMFKHKGKAR